MKIKNIIAMLVLSSLIFTLPACSLINSNGSESNDAVTDIESNNGKDGNNNDDGYIDIEIDLGGITDDDKKDETENIPAEDVVNTEVTYEQYLAMTPEQKQEHYNSFADPAEFFDWFHAAAAKYEEEHKNPELGENGSIDIEDILSGQ